MVQGMRENLNDFFNYGDSSRLFPLLFDFANSAFVAWIFSIIINWIRGLVVSRMESRKRRSDNLAESKSAIKDFRITKLEKPINEMNAQERRIAAEKIAEVMLDQANEYKKKE